MNPQSLEAYEKIKDKLTEKEQIVYLRIMEWPNGVTTNELIFILGWPINCISGRITGLKKKRMVISHEKRNCKETGCDRNAWRITTEDERKDPQYQLNMEAA